LFDDTLRPRADDLLDYSFLHKLSLYATNPIEKQAKKKRSKS
jgi:hypothetical protein